MAEPTTDILVTRAFDRMPGGVSTNIRLTEGPDKLIIRRAAGCRVWTHTGRELVDFVSGFGSILLGYAAEPLVSRQIETLRDGIGFTGTGTAEIEAADRLLRVHSRFDMVRFCATGSEATTAAIGLARVATGRRGVAIFTDHYHGWHGPTREEAIDVLTTGAHAVPSAPLYRLPFLDATACERFLDRHGRELACVIVELVMGSSGRAISEELLRVLHRARTECGFLLIVDEVITGFRLGLGGAQAILGAQADLAVFGKCLGGGMPIGAVVGPRELMGLFGTGAAMHAGTFNGHPLSMMSAIALIDYLEAHEPEFYESLYATGDALRCGLEAVLARHGVGGVVRGPGPFLVLEFPGFPTDAAAASVALQDALRQSGVRVPAGGRWFLNGAHTQEAVDIAVAAFDDFLAAPPTTGVFL